MMRCQQLDRRGVSVVDDDEQIAMHAARVTTHSVPEQPLIIARPTINRICYYVATLARASLESVHNLQVSLLLYFKMTAAVF